MDRIGHRREKTSSSKWVIQDIRVNLDQLGPLDSLVLAEPLGPRGQLGPLVPPVTRGLRVLPAEKDQKDKEAFQEFRVHQDFRRENLRVVELSVLLTCVPSASKYFKKG